MVFTLSFVALLLLQTVPESPGDKPAKPWLDRTNLPSDMALDSDETGKFVGCVSRSDAPETAEFKALCKQALARNAKARRLTPVDRAKWLADEVISDGSGEVRFALDVDGQGLVTSCRILTTSGDAATDQRVCDLLSSHAHFIVARSSEGIPLPATYQNSLRW